MYTSQNKNGSLKTTAVYMGISFFLILFGAVYEYFSHGVWSYYMVYAFIIPLVGGAVPSLIRYIRGCSEEAGWRMDLILWRAALATLTAGSIMKGVLDIYGTTNSLTMVYPVIGGALAAAAGLAAAIRRGKMKKTGHDPCVSHAAEL